MTAREQSSDHRQSDDYKQLEQAIARPALEGTLEPLRICLMCYRILQADGDGRVGKNLDAAYHLLQERAVAIEDEDFRRPCPGNVVAHREIAAEYAQHSGVTPR